MKNENMTHTGSKDLDVNVSEKPNDGFQFRADSFINLCSAFEDAPDSVKIAFVSWVNRFYEKKRQK